MNAPARLLPSVALGCVLLFAGCSHAPKPDADSAEEGRTAASPRARRTPRPPSDPKAGAVVAGSSTSAPAVADSAKAPSVVPQLSTAEAKELEKNSREQIDAALLKLGALDASKLDPEKQRKLQIAQGFLKDAAAARTEQDWMRASQLATKARLLADELAAR